ncbi:MAG TPA: DUF5652 family protein [Balneolaceae bacterium]|nr:DUF5652 family protein [Balneolaceae bacterium]
MNTFGGYEMTLILIILLITVWDLIWKIIALWKSARRDQKVWFVFLAIINSVGILPIIYLLLYKDQSEKVMDSSASDYKKS